MATDKLAEDYVNGRMSKEVEQEYINNIRAIIVGKATLILKKGR